MVHEQERRIQTELVKRSLKVDALAGGLVGVKRSFIKSYWKNCCLDSNFLGLESSILAKIFSEPSYINSI